MERSCFALSRQVWGIDLHELYATHWAGQSVGCESSLALRCQLNLCSPVKRMRCSSESVLRKSGSGS